MSALFQESSARRFCAQWHIFFSSDTPACLRLRPIVSPKHPLRDQLNVESVGSRVQEVLRYEIAQIDRLASSIPDLIDFKDLMDRAPEYAAFVVAAKLFGQGHNEQYLLRQEAVFSSMFGFKEARPRTESRLYKSMINGGAFLDVSALSKPLDIDCYFCVNTKKSLRVPGVKLLTFADLPNEVSQKFLEDTALSEADQKRYLMYSGSALDPHLAAETFAENLLGSASRTILRPGGASIELSDLHRNVVVFQDGRYARFNWIGHNLTFGGTVLDRAKLAQHADQIETSESFRTIVSTFSRASARARQNDTVSAFRSLIEGLDSLFRPAFALSGKPYNSREFVKYASFFMATSTQHDVFARCYREFRSQGGAPGIQALKEAKAGELSQKLQESDLSGELKGDRRYRMLKLASYIDRSARDIASFRRTFKKNLVRFFFDFTHLICFRNAMVHESRFFAEEYYVDELAQLFVSVIAFRLACITALRDNQHLRALFSKSDAVDECFVFCLKLLLFDGEATLTGGNPVWLNQSNIQHLHKAGWASWAAFKLGDLIHGNQARTEFLLKDFEPELIRFRDDDNIELL
jgi:hypothetical protein